MGILYGCSRGLDSRLELCLVFRRESIEELADERDLQTHGAVRVVQQPDAAADFAGQRERPRRRVAGPAVRYGTARYLHACFRDAGPGSPCLRSPTARVPGFR